MRVSLPVVGILTLGLLTTTLRAQDEPPEKPKEPVCAYFPLKIGYTWTYTSPEGEFEVKVKSKEGVGEKYKNCFRLETIKEGNVKAFEHIKVEDDGVFRCAFQGEVADPALKLLPLNPEKPDKKDWDIKLKISGMDVKARFTIGKKEKITVAGTPYDVFKVTSEETEIEIQKGVKAKVQLTYFFAKDVGMVKQILKVDKREVVIELKKFEKPS